MSIGDHLAVSRILFIVEMQVTAQEMSDARLPLHLRDFCAHLLIPLKKCQTEHKFTAWKCKHEEHQWQECQLEE